jgi:hypothetical protein
MSTPRPVSPPRRQKSSDSEGGSIDGKYRNNSPLIPELDPEESQTPFKQFHLLGAKVFIRSAAVITLYVSEAAVPAGKGDGIGKRTRLQISSRIPRVESPLAIRSHTSIWSMESQSPPLSNQLAAVKLPTQLNAHIHLFRSVRTIERQSYCPPPGCVSIMYNNFGARRIISVAKVHDANSIKAGINMI